MELMKEINTLANEYVPPVQEHVRTERMLKSMTPPKAKKDKAEPKKAKGMSIKNIFHSKK